MNKYYIKFFSFFKSIKSRIIISIALTAIITALSVGILSIEFSSTSIDEEANQKLTFMLKSYVNYFERYFSEVTKIADVLEYEILTNLDAKRIHDDKYLDELIEKIDKLVMNQAENSSQGKTAYVYFNPDLTGNAHDIYYADQNVDGKVERQEMTPTEYYKNEFEGDIDKSWWFKPVQTHKEYWSKPYIWIWDNGKEQEFVSYTRPVFIDGELLCVIGSDFLYENIDDKINGIKIYNTGYSFLLNENYDVISHPYYKSYKKSDDVNSAQYKHVIENIKGKTSNVFKFEGIDKVKKIVSLSQLSNGWMMGIVVNENEILSNVIDIKEVVYLVMIGMLVVSVFVAMRIGNRISKPIIAISNIVSNIGEENYTVTMSEEYLERKDELGILASSIKTMSLKIAEDIEKINHQNHILKYDSLTSAVNKDYFRQIVNHYIRDTEEGKYLAAMMTINIDNFRVINETMSYEIGNMLLYEVAQRLFASIRNEDILSRTDGDEFTIFFTKLEEYSEITPLADKTFQLFNTPFKVSNEEIFISISGGISLYPADGKYHDELFKNASSAINHVKLNKKNGYEFFQRNINKMTTEKYEIINNLRYALSRNEFELYYQPQIALNNKKIIGFEALLRWNSPNGNIPPNKFIPYAEEASLIIPIGEWVLKEACSMGVKLMNLGCPVIVGVNISAIQFKEAYLVELVEKILKETGLPPGYLDVEITESILMDNSIITSRILKELKEIGVSLSIDDFGTGYSSLSYLKNYVVDRLKIDRSFIRDIPDNDDGTIAKTIISLSKSLGIKTIAEGIEEKEQIDFLIENGCDEVQGYYYCRPIPEEKLITFIKEWQPYKH